MFLFPLAQKSEVWLVFTPNLCYLFIAKQPKIKFIKQISSCGKHSDEV